jgi:uncharacterized protein (DUF2141 family)
MFQPRRLRAAAALAALPVAAGLAALLTAPVNAQGGATPPAGCAGPASATWLNISAENLRSGNGELAITLYADDSRKFLAKKGSLYVGRVPARAGTTRACIFLPRPGVYAVALYHDENANRSFDRTGIGLPAEGYGFTNNPATLAGLPAFSSVRLNAPRTGLTARIQMKYP